jgi:hypothetical protein
LYEHGEGKADREPARVERDVERRRVAAVDEVLVQLVGRGVEDPERERREHPADRAVEQRAEDRVLGHVRALAEHLVPGAETARKRRDRGEPEDDPGPEDDRSPELDSAPKAHRGAMIGSVQLGER